MGVPWIHSYLPRSSSEVLGQSSAVSLVASSLRSWSRKSKPLWLWGPSGVGKTSLAVAFAQELGLELVEVNASDSRHKDALQSLVGGALRQGSLFGRGKLILIDEVDGLSGTKDRGALPELLRLVKGSPYPVVLTAQDPFQKKFSSLRRACVLVELSSLSSQVIADRLRAVLSSEGVSFEEQALQRLAVRSGGDLRAALNDAQTFSSGGSLRLVDVAALDDRDRVESIQSALLRVFKSTSAEVARGSFDQVDEDVGRVLLWVEQNLPEEYVRPLDRARAFDALSLADVFLGRIRRWQHYRFYVYAYDLLTAGVALAKDARYPGVRSFQQSGRLLQVWLAKQKNLKKQSVAEKLSVRDHCSVRDAVRSLPFVQWLCSHDSSLAERLASYYDLSSEELSWLSRDVRARS